MAAAGAAAAGSRPHIRPLMDAASVVEESGRKIRAKLDPGRPTLYLRAL